MKRFFLFLSFLLIGIVQTFAHDFMVDGIYYNILSGTTNVEVTRNNGQYNSYSGSVTIPSSVSYGGTTYSVTSIGNSAFISCSRLTSVVIPSSVTSIGNYAFNHCSCLTSVEIPSSVTSIGSAAFWGCSGLTSVVIPSSVTSIGSTAFSDCSGLTSVVIPSSVTSIGSNAFSGCSGLTSVDIPSSVTSIASSAFSGCSGLTSVVIPSSVTSIDSKAFDGCSGLTSIEIPSSVTSIASSAFSGCSGLMSVVIPSSVTSIGSAAFSSCSGLTSISVDVGNTVYDSRNNCNAIIKKSNNQLVAGCKNTVIPSSVTSIGYYAFKDCSCLTSVVIPSSVTSVDSRAFEGCFGLTSISVDAANTVYDSRNNCDAIIKKSYNQLVAGCKNTVIPSSVTSIGESAFSGCSGLTSVVIPSSVTRIGIYAFYGCSGLTSIVIPSSVTSIGNNAFQYCSGLTSVAIPSSVTSIGSSAFWGCSGLTSVAIPSSVTSIGNNAFYNCSGLTSVVIPSSVTSIGNNAFYNCSGLTSVVIPSSVTSIGNDAFSRCSGLTSVTMLCPPPSNIKSAQIRSAATIYVTRANYDAYTALGLSNRIEVFDDNILYLDEQELQAGSDATLSLKLKNNVSITSLQFDLVLPKGITIPNGSNGKPYIEVSSSRTTTSKHKVNSNLQEDGSLRVICTSFNNDTFSANDGEVLKIHVNVAVDATVGLHDIRLKNMELGEPNNTPHEVAEVMYPITISPASYTITATSANTTMGTVTGGGTYTHGASVTLTATPADGYEFVQWSDGTTANPYTFTATANKSVTAQFRAKSYTITATSANAEQGTVTGGGTYTHGATVTLTATPKTGYEFVQWSDGTTANPYTFTATADKRVTAQFQFAGIVGDVNNDSKITAADMVGAVNFILNTNTAGLSRAAADVNRDGDITVADATGIVNLALGLPLTASSNQRRVLAADSEVRLTIDAFRLAPGADEFVPVVLCAEADEFTALQFDVLLPEGIRLTDVLCDDDHIAAFAQQADGKVRIVVLSPDNVPFAGNGLAALILQLAADAAAAPGAVAVDAIEVARPDMSRVAPAAFSAAFGVAGPTGIESVESTGNSRLFDIQGRRTIGAGHGIYVTQGRKVVK